MLWLLWLRSYTYRFCSPTRAALMTGRLPIHVNQMNSAEYPWTAAAMHPSFRTVADVLRDKAGYATHQFGKWHLGLARHEFTPAGRGFDTSVGYLSGSERHFTHLKVGLFRLSLRSTAHAITSYQVSYHIQ
jgi:arylsulfatase B